MLAAEILRALPGDLTSAVVFRLEALRPLADDDLLRQMFALPESVRPDEDTHVVLTPLGPLMATPSQGRIRFAGHLSGAPMTPATDSLLARFAHRLALLPSEEPDCLGVGQLPGGPPVGLHVVIDGMLGHGVAALSAEPPRSLELLRAVGVEYIDGKYVGDSYVARFRNRLDQHLLAGALSGFARTDHCNLFFLHQANIGTDIEGGLLHAAASRIARSRDKARAATAGMAAQAVRQPLSLTCIPPPPLRPEPYGDVVPLGFLLAALPGTEDSRTLREHLAKKCHDGLWPFHTGGLPTSTDTTLAGLAMSDPRTVASLERFNDGHGGYLPQLWSQAPERGRMVRRSDNAHWCQPDFATTCLVVMFRRRAGLSVDRSLQWIRERVDERRGLFFANPFLVDWAMAQAVSGHVHPPETERTRAAMAERLRTELVAAQNPDGSFGRYDQALSTSLAILALAQLGDVSRPVLMAQLRLLDWISLGGQLPAATPFFSSLCCSAAADVIPTQHVLATDESLHALTFYRDDVATISTPLAALALSVTATFQTSPTDQQPDPQIAEARGIVSPRYRCPDPAAYIGGFVIRPTRPMSDQPRRPDGRTDDDES